MKKLALPLILGLIVSLVPSCSKQAPQEKRESCLRQARISRDNCINGGVATRKTPELIEKCQEMNKSDVNICNKYNHNNHN